MAHPNDIVEKDGQRLTQRVWDLIDHVSGMFGIDLMVGQGGFKNGTGADASAGTHDKGDVFDIRVVNVPEHLRDDVAVAFRSWSGCAWPRDPEHGWTKTDPHIHCVMRDSHYPLSPGARAQVYSYDRNLNGLANGAHDNIPHPVQRTWPPVLIIGEEEDMFILRTKDGKGPHYTVSGRVYAALPAGYKADDDVQTITVPDDGSKYLAALTGK